MSTAGTNSPPTFPFDVSLPYDAPIAYDGGAGYVSAQKTLLQLRNDMMVRLGYAAMLASPPPGMVEELNSYLYDAQQQLYLRYDTLRTERWWGFNTVEGASLYATPYDGTIPMNTRKITGAFVADTGAWFTLRGGIDPIDFGIGESLGIPTHYEFREYLEVWPTPNKVYTLWFKGHMGLKPLTADTDTCTIDEHVVFLFALANAKNHRGQPDAQAYAQMAERMIHEHVAGAHGTRRYFPRPSTQGMVYGAAEWGNWSPCHLPRGTWR